MKKIKKVLIGITIIFIILATKSVFAVNTEKIKEYVEKNGLKANTITASEILTMYQELSKEYSNSELYEALNEYSAELNNAGISSESISTGKAILNSTNAKTLNNILNDINIDDIKDKLEKGATAEEIVNNLKDNISTKKKASIAGKIILGNKTAKVIIILGIIYIVYMIIIRGFVFVKANEKYWITFIPIYRDIILFKICGYSAWWELLLLFPIVGWFLYIILRIIINFELSKAFGKNNIFGFGIWIFKPIFESLIAFSEKCKFIEIENNIEE